MTRFALATTALLAVLLGPAAARAQDASVGCGNVGYVGCCIDDTHSQYCSNGKLVKKTCSGATPSCGWNKLGSNFVYTCGTTKDADPSGTYKRLCTAIPDGGPVPDPDWSVKTDKGTPKTEAGTKADSGTAVPCGSIPTWGCCEDDTTVKFCLSGSPKTKTCTGATPKCGWSKDGYYCGTTTDADPTGAKPRLCSAAPNPDGSVTKKDTGTSPTGDTGTAGDTGGTTPKKDTGTTKPKTTDDEGCACSLSSQATAGGVLVLAGALFIFALARRRRR
jgi:MYXO-CTERM domain-containing protein